MAKVRVIDAEATTAPKWVKEAGLEAMWAWRNQYQWRCNAFCATVEDYQRFLVKEAQRSYWED